MSEQLRKNLDFALTLSRKTRDVVTLYQARYAGTSRDAGLMVLFGAPAAMVHGGYALYPIASFRRGRRVVEKTAAVA